MEVIKKKGYMKPKPKSKAQHIRVTGSVEVVEAQGGRFSLEELQRYVGGYIERVMVGGRTMWVNEEGRIMGLPVNKRASELAAQEIVGDVLMMEGKRAQ